MDPSTTPGVSDPEGVQLSESAFNASKVLFGPMVEEILEHMLTDVRNFALKSTQEAIREALDQLPPQKVEISVDGELLSTVSRQHYLFPAMLRLLAASDRFGNKLNIALTGPTGSGKTEMCLSAAKALRCEYVLQPFNPQTTKSDLLGYMNAAGSYVASPFYSAFQQGKLFVADEFDAAAPAVATILNAAVSNRVMTYPNGETVTAHKDFRAVFCMNTYGTGADDRYTGRSRLDMATLDRLVFLRVPIDRGLEAALIGIADVASPEFELNGTERFDDEKEILQTVVSLREAIENLKLRHSVSPRATMHACALHDAGFDRWFIEECCIWRGMSEPDRAKIQKEVSSSSSDTSSNAPTIEGDLDFEGKWRGGI